MNRVTQLRTHDVSIRVLKKLGNPKPTFRQISLLHSLLFHQMVEHQLAFVNALTEREIGCLRLAAAGKSASEIASLLNIKKTTVDTHYQKIKRKLECKSMAQAVYEGIHFGYLAPRSMNKKFKRGEKSS